MIIIHIKNAFTEILYTTWVNGELTFGIAAIEISIQLINDLLVDDGLKLTGKVHGSVLIPLEQVTMDK